MGRTRSPMTTRRFAPKTAATQVRGYILNQQKHHSIKKYCWGGASKTFKIKCAGCLYTYTGTEQHYCFKELPKVEVKVNAKEYNVSRPCLANFPGITYMTEEEQASLCCGHQV